MPIKNANNKLSQILQRSRSHSDVNLESKDDKIELPWTKVLRERKRREKRETSGLKALEG